MLTQSQKDCYRGKIAFIKELNKVFKKEYSGIPVEGVSIEFYQVGNYVDEYIVVKYRGGAYAPRIANVNSNSANFRIVSDLINGGYYEERDRYDQIKKTCVCLNKEILK